MKLGQILVRKGLISLNQLQEILQIQSIFNQKIREILRAKGLINPVDLQAALKEQYWRIHGFWVID